jgi:hypothetical protein
MAPTRHYVNGVQKRRERPECGRESGVLSQYVAFIDVYVGRTDVKRADAREFSILYWSCGVALLAHHC